MRGPFEGPMRGHAERARGSPKKTIKKAKFELTEEEMETQWQIFKSRHEDIFLNEDSTRYKHLEPLFAVDMYLKPPLQNIE